MADEIEEFNSRIGMAGELCLGISSQRPTASESWDRGGPDKAEVANRALESRAPMWGNRGAKGNCTLASASSLAHPRLARTQRPDGVAWVTIVASMRQKVQRADGAMQAQHSIGEKRRDLRARRLGARGAFKCKNCELSLRFAERPSPSPECNPANRLDSFRGKKSGKFFAVTT
ncbi:uncharacterized protein CIMG_13104 [Coccidioides immitis RS]|uniref:Uncharacterized protein n=1 Tax=Coccidioides immitis (strain RS) TaxID=246410 RepID=A0A0D8JWK6_COCIM|nr:uncharacterized protein CIMG_13104 [Coccidioides immitis RS]KJF60658.1 hypothetical protein CIMG_13104 [Coccidioides immitis RS]